jgi:hypothetical protein
MAVPWIVAIAVLVTAFVLGGAVVLGFRALDRRASARDRAILGALEQLRGKVEQIDATTREAAAAAPQPIEATPATGSLPPPAAVVVKIGDEEVELDAEMMARLDAVTDKSNARGGMNALYAALAQGLALAERGFGGEEKPAEGERKGEEAAGRVVPLRPRGKPPDDKGGGAA